MRYFRLYAIGATIVIAGVMLALYQYDLATNYVPVEGHVSEIATLCRLEKTDQYIVAREEHKTNAVPCEMAQAAIQPGQRFAGYKIVPQTEISWNYVSPVDHMSHTGHTQRDGDRNKWPAPGSVIKIYAHKTKAAKSAFVT